MKLRITGLLAAALLTVSLGACADDAPGVVSNGSGGGAVAAPASAVTITPDEVVEFRAKEFQFTPSELIAEPGVYKGRLVNDGTMVHDIQFGGGEIFSAKPGESVEFEFEVPENGVEFICTVPGHADAGMVGMVYPPGGIAAAAPSGGEHAHAGPVPAPDVAPDPNAPPYEWRDPTPPARGEGEGVKLVPGGAPGGGDLIEVEFEVVEKVITVAEGFQQMAWTFNGTVPGPVLRTKVGDTVRVHLVNPPEAMASHSIDFHASQVAMNDEMRSIAPGEDLIYEFTTDYAGVWMYHCGTDPVLHHIANGMFGMVIVEPEEGLPPVDHEYFLIQHEWYLGPQGEISSYAKMNVAAPAPDFVMFNGAAFQYSDTPIEVPVGDTVRMYLLDAGPSIDSSFHIVGLIFHEVRKEGVHLKAGNEGNWGSQAVDLAPAQGAYVEFVVPEDGIYAFVTHAFNFPGRGAVGLVQGGDGIPSYQR